MRLTSVVVSAIALAAIAISAAVVLDKDSPSDLAVRVEGVPGYVYYSRPYVITIQYVNNGSDTARSAELAASLPPGFALQGEHDGAPQGQRVVWNLGDLAAGEAGAIQFTILGTPPSDLTGAVYDLPGYVGHTAFEDGFRLAVELTSNAGRADALARADTGEPSSPTATSTPPPPTATATPPATSEPFFPDLPTQTPSPTPTLTPTPPPQPTATEDPRRTWPAFSRPLRETAASQHNSQLLLPFAVLQIRFHGV